jgi:hypothetical protein
MISQKITGDRKLRKNFFGYARGWRRNYRVVQGKFWDLRKQLQLQICVAYSSSRI